MKNKTKNFILFLAVVLSIGLVTPSFAVGEVGQSSPLTSPVSTQQPVADTASAQSDAHKAVTDQNVANTSSKTSLDFATKTPMGRKQLAIKFLIAMMGVVVSSVVIFVGLSLYNKLMYGTTTRTKDDDYSAEDDEYKTPSNMKEALNIFLKKTK